MKLSKCADQEMCSKSNIIELSLQVILFAQLYSLKLYMALLSCYRLFSDYIFISTRIVKSTREYDQITLSSILTYYTVFE